MPTLKKVEPQNTEAIDTFDSSSTVRTSNQGERPMTSSEGTSPHAGGRHDEIPGHRGNIDAKNDEPMTTREGTPDGEPSSAHQSSQSDQHDSAAAAYGTQAESMTTSQTGSLLNTQAPSSPPSHIYQTAEQSRAKNDNTMVCGMREANSTEEVRQQRFKDNDTNLHGNTLESESASKLTLLPEGTFVCLFLSTTLESLFTSHRNRQRRCN